MLGTDRQATRRGTDPRLHTPKPDRVESGSGLPPTKESDPFLPQPIHPEWFQSKEDKVKKIPLRKKGGSVCAHTLVGDADFEWLNRWQWHLGTHGYASRTTETARDGKRMYLMHRQILGLGHGDRRQGDHRNRNRLDNQRSNLRIAARGARDNSQNQGLYSTNKSGYRGVSWCKRTRKWSAQVALNGQSPYLGMYDTPEEADRAVKAFRAEHMPFSEDALTTLAP